MTMRPTERLAALRLLETAIKHEIAEATDQALAFAEQTGGKTFTTDWGTVSVTNRKPAPQIIDERELVAWFEANAPEEIERRVNDRARRAFLASCQIDGDQIITSDGEVIPWMRPGSPKTGIAVRNTPEAKELAIQEIRGRLNRLVALPATDSEVAAR